MGLETLRLVGNMARGSGTWAIDPDGRNPCVALPHGSVLSIDHQKPRPRRRVWGGRTGPFTLRAGQTTIWLGSRRPERPPTTLSDGLDGMFGEIDGRGPWL